MTIARLGFENVDNGAESAGVSSRAEGKKSIFWWDQK
jgi:hypothetical protein